MGSHYSHDDEATRSCAKLVNATEVARAYLERPVASANDPAELLQQQPCQLLGRYAHTFREHTHASAAQKFEGPALVIRGGSGSASPDAASQPPPSPRHARAMPRRTSEDTEDTLAPASAPTQPMQRHASGMLLPAYAWLGITAAASAACAYGKHSPFSVTARHPATSSSMTTSPACVMCLMCGPSALAAMPQCNYCKAVSCSVTCHNTPQPTPTLQLSACMKCQTPPSACAGASGVQAEQDAPSEAMDTPMDTPITNRGHRPIRTSPAATRNKRSPPDGDAHPLASHPRSSPAFSPRAQAAANALARPEEAPRRALSATQQHDECTANAAGAVGDLKPGMACRGGYLPGSLPVDLRHSPPVPPAASSAPLPHSSSGPFAPPQPLLTFDEQKFLCEPLRIRSSGGDGGESGAVRTTGACGAWP